MEYLSPISGATIRHAGFTLLEVLVALLVLSIGLLGIAALQGIGLRSTHGAYVSSQASLLAYDMADRIRSNPAGFGAMTTAEENEGGAPPQSSGTLTAACSTPASNAPLEVVDLAQWACSVQDVLPSGSGSVQRTVNANSVTFTIRVEWLDRQREGDENDRWNFQVSIDI